MPTREGYRRGPNPASDTPGRETLGAAEEATAPATVRVHSLSGAGFVDDRFGVSFVGQPYADVPADLADRMVAYRPDAVRTEDGVDEVVPAGAEPLYALEAPALKATNTGEVTGG